MPRSFSLAATQSLTGQQTSIVWLTLLTITHVDIVDSPLRFVNNNTDITSNGNVYTAYPFEVFQPDDTEERPPTVSLKIDNVDRRISIALRGLTPAPTVDVSLVTSNDFDVIESGPITFTLEDVRLTDTTAVGNLIFSDMLREPYPGSRFSIINFPGLF